jgi:5-methylcytosine-specific restriction endonuclease McrA
MVTILRSFDRCSNAELLVEIKRLARCEREATAALIASLMELDARQLYLAEGCSSLFTYCTEVLHLSEHAAYGRIKAARIAQAFPVVLDLLVDGEIHLTTVTLLATHLTQENHVAVLAEARHKTKRQVEELAARLAPRPAVAATIRKCPERKPPTPSPAPQAEARDHIGRLTPHVPVLAPPVKAAEVTPLAPERYKMQFTIGGETHAKLRRVQDLLRHTLPSGDPAAIFDKALTLLLIELERTKAAVTDRPRAPRATAIGSRHLPASVRRKVWARDGARCAFVGTNGRCSESSWLEFHHIVPFADGGASTVGNIELRCRAHNQFEAEQWFGPRVPMLARERGAEFGSAAPDPTRSGTSVLSGRAEVAENPVDSKSPDLMPVATVSRDDGSPSPGPPTPA